MNFFPFFNGSGFAPENYTPLSRLNLLQRTRRLIPNPARPVARLLVTRERDTSLLLPVTAPFIPPEVDPMREADLAVGDPTLALGTQKISLYVRIL